MSTGIGFGIAIPHARTDLVTVMTAAVGRSQKGIQFEAVDGKPVDLVILYLAR
jgi:mannitol/fructose-specific phosphotransferase system IIA component (Ntr-type)